MAILSVEATAMTIQCQGTVAPGFEPVAEAFAAGL